MKIERTAMEYSYKKDGCGYSPMKSAGGRVSVFHYPVPYLKGKYFLFND